jgi:cation diffusion facilitator CzcD-associated flavoprotein CzcO
MLDWLVVGGGIHGSYHAARLHRRGAPCEGLRIVDPHAAPLARWSELTQRVGVSFLRSPVVHHLSDDPWSLKRFADGWRNRDGMRHYITSYKRPSLGLFNAHARRQLEECRVAEHWVQGMASGLERIDGGWRVRVTPAGGGQAPGDVLDARRVLLATGPGESLRLPAWVEGDVASRTFHVFGPAPVPPFHEDMRTVVMGGGSTAVQVALLLGRRYPGRVTLLSRHELRRSHFDADQAWMGPARLDGFHREQDMGRRRMLIRQGRLPGTCPPELLGELTHLRHSAVVQLRIAGVRSADVAGGEVLLELDDGSSLRAARIVLATGYDQKRPGGAWLDAAVAECGLPLAPCGYPVLDQRLCWAPGLYVSGPLAELEIGPVARNLLGARLAGERLDAA